MTAVTARLAIRGAARDTLRQRETTKRGGGLRLAYEALEADFPDEREPSPERSAISVAALAQIKAHYDNPKLDRALDLLAAGVTHHVAAKQAGMASSTLTDYKTKIRKDFGKDFGVSAPRSRS
jgi:hypothetical protein